jgi:hypothetical protein
MIVLKTHKTLQHVSIHFYIVLVRSSLKSLIKTVRSQIFLVMRQRIIGFVRVLFNVGRYADSAE